MNKENIETLIRIRPQNIVAIISNHSEYDHFLKTIRFLSMTWGGSYARLVYVDFSSTNWKETLHKEINALLPEVVLFSSEQEKICLSEIRCICHPKAVYIEIESPEERLSSTGLIHYNNVLREHTGKHPDLIRDNLYLIEADCVDQIHECQVAATFGIAPINPVKDLSTYLKSEYLRTSIVNYQTYAKLCADMSPRMTWLNFLDSNLSGIYGVPLPPSVVVISEKEPLQDLVLFWNMRVYFGSGHKDSLFLFPEKEIQNSNSIQQLSSAIANSSINSTYCEMYSAECKRSVLESLARRLRPRIRKEKAPKEYYVDIKQEGVPYWIGASHKEEKVAFNSADNSVEMPCIAPDFLSLSVSQRWCCDLVKDLRTNRYPFELSLPKNASLLKLMNLPHGTFANFSDVVTFGPEYFSILLSNCKNKAPTRFTLPTDREIFETLLSEGNVSLDKDEKNIRYTETIKLFGSLSEACSAFTGISWRILDALRNGPLTYAKIKSYTKPGKSSKSVELSEFAKFILKDLKGNAHKIAKRRMLLAHGDSLHSKLSENEALALLLIRQLKYVLRLPHKQSLDA